MGVIGVNICHCRTQALRATRAELGDFEPPALDTVKGDKREARIQMHDSMHSWLLDIGKRRKRPKLPGTEAEKAMGSPSRHVW